MRELATRVLLRQLVDRADPAVVTPTEDELRDAGEAFRVSRGLADANDVARWLEARGMTWAMLLARVRRDISVAKLRAHVVGPEIEAHFAEHARDYDCVLVEELFLEPGADVEGSSRASARAARSASSAGARCVRVRRAAYTVQAGRRSPSTPWAPARPSPFEPARTGPPSASVEVERFRTTLDDETRAGSRRSSSHDGSRRG